MLIKKLYERSSFCEIVFPHDSTSLKQISSIADTRTKISFARLSATRKTQSVPYLRYGGYHASAFLVRVLLFASFYLSGK